MKCLACGGELVRMYRNKYRCMKCGRKWLITTRNGIPVSVRLSCA